MDSTKLQGTTAQGCTPNGCTQADIPMIARKHGPDSCPVAPPPVCSECGTVKPDVPALLVSPWLDQWPEGD